MRSPGFLERLVAWLVRVLDPPEWWRTRTGIVVARAVSVVAYSLALLTLGYVLGCA